MRIYFDFEVDAAKSGLDLRLGEDVKSMMEELRNFVAFKLSAHKEEIEREPKGYVQISVGGENPITYFYPEELAKKLINCINEEDYTYIMTKIYYNHHQQ